MLGGRLAVVHDAGAPAGRKRGPNRDRRFLDQLRQGHPHPLADDRRFFNRLATTTEEHQLKWHPWLPEPVPEGSASFSFPLRHTDIDFFQHLNNTNYWHAVHEGLARYPKITTAPYRAVMEYRRPITHDEPVTIRHCPSDASVRFWFCVGDEVRAAAMAATLTP